MTVRYAKRGRSRSIPLAQDALEAIVAWVKVRPMCATDHILVSMSRTGSHPRTLTNRDAGRIVAHHAAQAGLPEDRRTPPVLRHTFCTHLADTGASVEEIRELAGHADIRTTTIYTAVNAERLEQRVAATRARRTGLARLTANDS